MNMNHIINEYESLGVENWQKHTVNEYESHN